MEQFRQRTHSLYERVADQPLAVDSVRIEPRGGAPLRTRQALLDRELERVLSARSLREVHAALETAVEHLRQLEAFKRVDALIDDEPAGVPGVCSVGLELEECGWYKGGGNEGHVQANLLLRNLAGSCEQWRLMAEYGHRYSFDFSAMYRLPRAGGGDWTVRGRETPDISVFRRNQNLDVYSSYADTMRGLELGASSADGASRLSYTWGWRSLVTSASASRAVCAQRGDFLSDALRWAHVVDERDDATVHTEGWGARFLSELGGLYPGARFRYAKQRLDWVWAAPLSDSVAINVTLGAGEARVAAAAGPAGGPPPTCIADRFFLGGSDSVRGFAYRGLGPGVERPPRRDSGGGDGGGGGGAGDGGEAPAWDALGGDLFGTLYAGLVSRLPGALGDVGGCAHVFVNGGSAALLSGGGRRGSRGGGGGAPAAAGLGAAVRSRMGDLAATARWSAGVGLVLPTPLGRFEANYVWVLSAQPGDLPRAGMQFGFAASPITPAGPA
ncbi:MAG: surface antigen-domain-containing protein [Monoraphidium minutum]|nr:MAG: surface antigen-domain-containing protein [Monoraphidium minutum]